MAASKGVCEVCQAEPSKYCCPKCALRSCSVTCVTAHKLEINCDGIRDRTAYVPLNKFDDFTLLNDYRLLEETARCVNNAERNLDPKASMTKYGDEKLPYTQHRLIVECRRRRITLRIMPKTFQRRCQNTTHFKFNEKKLYWRLEWSFPQAEEVMYTDESVAEDCTLAVAIEKYLSSDLSDSPVSARLVYYQSAGYGGVVPLLKAAELSSEEPKYYELDFSETITSNLRSKTIIEFPTIIIVMKEHLHCYSIMDEEEDDTSLERPKRNYRQKRKKEQILSEGECSETSTDEE